MEGGQCGVQSLVGIIACSELVGWRVMKYNVISTRLTGGCLVLVVNVMTVMWPDCLTYDPRVISGGWVGPPGPYTAI